VEEANHVTGTKYGFVLGEAESGGLLGDFVCSQNAPEKPGDIAEGQYTYCQNSGDSVKVGLAWKELELKKELFLKRAVNTVAGYVEKEGEYQCREDDSFVSNDIGGVVSDCVISMNDGSSYYMSAYFFYPDNTSGMSHVLYAYSLKSTDSQAEVMRVVRSVAKGVSLDTKKFGFFDFDFITVAYAQDSGGGDAGGGDAGGGDGGGDAGGGCGCDGSGDTGGSTGGGDAGGSPGDTGGGAGGGDGSGGSGGGGECMPGCPSDGPGDGIDDGSSDSPGTEDPITRGDNLPPRVNAGPDIHITLPEMSTYVSGASAFDPEGYPVSLRWIRSSSLAYESLIANGTTLTPTMSRLMTPGSYVLSLIHI
jgi:hypothetical protein